VQITHEQNMTRSLRIPRSFWYSVAFAILFLVLFGVWIALAGTSVLFPQQVKLGLVLASFVSVVLSWIGVKRASQSADAGGVPSLQSRGIIWSRFSFRLALMCQGIGNIVYAYNYWHQVFVFPSWADAIVLLTMYPALFVGIMRLPARSLSGTGRTRLVLDSLLLIMAVITLSWYFSLGPALLHVAGESLLILLASLAYPTFDLLLIICLLLFTALHSVESSRWTIALLMIALVVLAITDGYASFCVLQQQVYLSAWPNLGWVLVLFVLALATQTMSWPSADQRADETSSSASSSFATIPLWRMLLPYSLIAPVIGLIVYVWGMNKGGLLTQGTYVCGLALLVVIFLKQVFSIQETNRLNRGLQQAHLSLSEAYIGLEVAHTMIQKQALTDGLTGLPNHRAVMDQFSKELDRAQRYGRPFSVLFFDADRFKHINDTYGHTAGDAVLCQIGKRAAGVLRGKDTLGRFGGEEFVVLLPEVDTSEASVVAEGIRAAVAAQLMATAEVEGGILMTVSIGIATYLLDGDTEEALLQQADEAMYLSKRLGRNQVRTAEEGRQASADPELMLLLQASERDEARERQGLSPQQVKEDYILKMIASLQFLVEQRDLAMYEHASRVSTLATGIAQALALPEQDVFLIRTAAFIHDIGKVGLPDMLLRKSGPLTPTEQTRLREHPELGAQILQFNPFLHNLIPAVRHHHERWDGTGYPNHLKGEDIPLSARIIGVAEAYDSVQRERSYQGSHTQEETLAKLQRGVATQFDPTVVQALMVVLTNPQKQQLSLHEVG
jgi:diguanylate cyclase (GGDEF)-like protein/putative nucleotidyltransferase with HDIG domain